MSIPIISGAPVSGTNAVQTITISGSPTGGAIFLAFKDSFISAIAHNASAATVQAALEAASAIGPGNVAVIGDAGGPWAVTFQGALARTAVPMLSVRSHSLTGGSSPSVAVAQTTPGVAPSAVGTPTGGVVGSDEPALYQNTGSESAPVLTALQPLSEKAQPNGYASLGAGGRVPLAQLASGTPDGTKFVRDDGVLAVPAGGGSGVVQAAEVILNDAQIKALPTTAHTLIAGVDGVRPQVLSVALSSHIVAPYTNVGPTNGYLVIGTTAFDESEGLEQGDLSSALTTSLTSGDAKLQAKVFAPGYLNLASVLGDPLLLFASNQPEGDFEDGDPSNTLTVTVYYIPVEP